MTYRFILLYNLMFFSIFKLTAQHENAVPQKNKWDVKAEKLYEFGKQNMYAKTDSVIAEFLDLSPHIEEISNYKNQFNIYNMLGIGYQVKSDFNVSNIYLRKADSIASFNNDTVLVLKSNHNIAINNRYLGNYEKALRVYFKNITLAKEINYISLIGSSLSEIANVYILTENWSKAYEYQTKALQFHKANNNTSQIGTAYNSLAYIYSTEGNPYYNLNEALVMGDSAIHYLQKSNNLIGLANAKRKNCTIYGKLNQFEKAIQCNLNALKMDEKLNNEEGILINKINLAKNYTNVLKHKKANKYIVAALTKAKKMNKKRFVQELYQSLAINYRNLDNYKLAYEYTDSANIIKDSLKGLEINKELADLEAKYQLVDKERTILKEQQKSDQLEKEKKIAKLENQRKSNWIIFLVVLILLTVIAVYLFVQNNKKQQKLKEEALLTEEKQKALKAVIEAQEEERKRIAKDLHDGIGQKLSGLKMGWNRVAKETDNPNIKERVEELSEVLNATADEIRAISHKMMPVALREVGISAALKSMLENTFRFSEMDYTYDEVNVEGRFSEKVEVTIYRIAQELVNNVIKHSHAKIVNVQLLRNKTHLVLMVQDDGKGVNIADFKKGHGYMNINSRLSINDGEINLESQKDQGLFAQVRVKV